MARNWYIIVNQLKFLTINSLKFTALVSFSRYPSIATLLETFSVIRDFYITMYISCVSAF